MSCKLLSNPGKTPQHLHFQKRSWGFFLLLLPFVRWGTTLCCENTLLPLAFLPSSPLFLLRLLKFTSSWTCRFCTRKEEISTAIPTHFCVLGGSWSPRGHPCHGVTSEPAAWEAAWGCLCPGLEGNFRKVTNELLNFTVKKSSLVAPVWFPRWSAVLADPNSLQWDSGEHQVSMLESLPTAHLSSRQCAKACWSLNKY